MKRDYYGVYAKAPGERKRLHTWPISKASANSAASHFRSDLARKVGWSQVSVKKLSHAQIDKAVARGRSFSSNSLPPEMRHLLMRMKA